MSGNNASGLTSVTGVLLVWATLVFAVRIWVKTRLRTVDFWGHDDTSVSVSFVLVIAQVAAVFHAISLGYGDQWSDLSEAAENHIQQSLYASQLLYVCSMGCTRLSTCLFTASLSRHRRHQNAGHFWTVVCLIIVLASFLIIAIRGNLSHPWTTLDGTEIMYYRWLGVEIAGLALDVCVFATAAALVWGLHMPAVKRVLVSMVFLTRLLIVPFVVLRLRQLHPSRNPSSSLSSSQPNQLSPTLTSASLHIAFILATVTCLKPFLRPFHEGHLITTTTGVGAGGSGSVGKLSGYINSRSHNSASVNVSVARHQHKASEYVMLSTAKDNPTIGSDSGNGDGDGKQATAAVVSITEEHDALSTTDSGSGKVTDKGDPPSSVAPQLAAAVAHAFVPETHGSHRSTVVPGDPERDRSRDRDLDRDRARQRHGSTDSAQMFISKTQTWTVEYLDRLPRRGRRRVDGDSGVYGMPYGSGDGDSRRGEDEGEGGVLPAVRPSSLNDRSSSSLDVGRMVCEEGKGVGLE